MDVQNLFKLKDGRYITSEQASKKMACICQAKPESYHMDSTGYSQDESGMAELFTICYKDDVRYCPEKKSWYAYKNGIWEKDIDSLIVSAKIKEFVQLMGLYCWEIKDEEIRTRYLKFVAKMGDRRWRDRLLKDARDGLTIPASRFDTNPYLINCLNGTYNLKERTFEEHKWDDFLTMRTNFEYTVDRDSICERWEEFIDDVTNHDKEKADYLQRALGYSLLGLANEECMFILHGKTTRNGKSTLLGTIHHLLGDYADVSPVSIICKADRAKSADTASPTIARLKGKRLVTMAESNQYGKLDEEVIKQLTGGEEITARNLYESPITFLPQFSLWLSCNDLPSVNDKSLFASERIKVIEFNRHFNEAERDVTLKQQFKEPKAMMGIFAWLVRGYEKYEKYGLKMCNSMKQVIKQYEQDNDLVLQFLLERCEQIQEGGTKAKVLYDAYKMWCKSNGYFVCSAKKFNAGLAQHPEWYTDKRASNGYQVYDGIGLREQN